MTRIELFKAVPRADEWAPKLSPFTFRPVHADQGVYCAVLAPDGWMLVGEPEPLLVHRLSGSDFTTRSATEVFYHAAMALDGFAIDAESLNRTLTAVELLTIVELTKPDKPGRAALPPPSANGSGGRLPRKKPTS